MKISTILEKIDENQLFVPAFQREYVWKRDDAKQLIDSLIKEYPTGTMVSLNESIVEDAALEWSGDLGYGTTIVADGVTRPNCAGAYYVPSYDGPNVVYEVVSPPSGWNQ